MNIESATKTVQVVSVVIGVVISILSFNAAREKDLETRRLEVAKPFLELRQKLYMEALKTAGILSTPQDRTKAELDAAQRRFRELYVAELSMVEAPEVEGKMQELAAKVDPSLVNLNPAQTAAYHLAHALRDTFTPEWGVTNSKK